MKKRKKIGIILKIIALVFCIFGIAFLISKTDDYTRSIYDSDLKLIQDAMNTFASIYTIILATMLGLLICKNLAIDRELQGLILIFGAVSLLASGSAVVSLIKKHTTYGASCKHCVPSGSMAIVAGILLFVDAIKTFI